MDSSLPSKRLLLTALAVILGVIGLTVAHYARVRNGIPHEPETGPKSSNTTARTNLDGEEKPKPVAPTRIALMAPSRETLVQNSVDLAVATLSATPGISLVERTVIDKVLAEQHLSLSGQVDGEKAVAAGKLLDVDLFAAAEVLPGAKEACGLVVFDAHSGCRLSDVGLPAGAPAVLAAAMSAAVQEAVRKHSLSKDRLRTVAVVGVRNADLPRSMDSVVDALGVLLERGLTHSPSVAVLERRRLEMVNRERTLPTQTSGQALWAAPITLDVEIARAKRGNRLSASLFVTRPEAGADGRVVARVEGENPASLAEALLQSALKEVQAAPPRADRAAETRRFLHEARVAWQHEHLREGLRSAEAAHAVDPANRQVGDLLQQYLLEYACDLLDPGQRGTFYLSRNMLKLRASGLDTAMDLGRRVADERSAALARIQPRTAQGLRAYIPYIIGNRVELLENKLAALDGATVPPNARAAIDRFQKGIDDWHIAELDAWAEAVRGGDPQAFMGYSAMVHTRARPNGLPGARCLPDRLVRIIRSWLAIVPRDPDAQIFVPSINTALEALIEHLGTPEYIQADSASRAQLDALLIDLAKHPHPVVAVFGRLGQLQLSRKVQRLSAAAVREQFDDLQRAGYALIAVQPPGRHLDLLKAYTASGYRFLPSAIRTIYDDNPNAQYEALYALCDFTLGRSDCNYWVVTDALQRAVQSRHPDYKRRWGIIQRTLARLESPECALAKDDLERNKKHFQSTAEAHRAEHPDLAPRPTTPPPWEQKRLLLDLTKKPDALRVFATGRSGTDLVLGAWAFEGIRDSIIQPIVISADGEPQFLTRLVIKGVHTVTAVCADERTVFVGTDGGGIYAFPRSGGPGRKLGDELPSKSVYSMTMLKGTIYAGLKGGYLVALNPESGRFEVLASSQRKDKRSPFDDSDLLEVRCLVGDPDRNRILFLAIQKANPFPDPPSPNGLWAFDAKTGKFTRILAMFFPANNMQMAPQHNGVLWINHYGLIRLDLATDKPELVWASHAIGPTMPVKDARYRNVVHSPSLVYQDGWLWTHGWIGRVNLADDKQEYFGDHFKPNDKSYFSVSFLEPGNRLGEILVGDLYRIWRVQMPTGAKK